MLGHPLAARSYGRARSGWSLSCQPRMTIRMSCTQTPESACPCDISGGVGAGDRRHDSAGLERAGLTHLMCGMGCITTPFWAPEHLPVAMLLAMERARASV